MTSTATNSCSITPISKTEKLKSDKFALLAMVGRRKKEVSQLQEETDVYFITVTELLAASVEQLTFLQASEATNPHIAPLVLRATSRVHRSIKRLLNYYPKNSASEKRLLDLLTSGGLETMIGVTAEGYLSLSTDQILRNVERCIEVTKEASQKASRTSATRTR